MHQPKMYLVYKKIPKERKKKAYFLSPPRLEREYKENKNYINYIERIETWKSFKKKQKQKNVK